VSSDTLLTNSLGDGSTLSLDFTTMSTTADLTARGLTFTRGSGTNIVGGVTYIGSDGLVKYAGTNVARFDYDPTTLAPRGLLVEGQTQNLVTYSDLRTTGWSGLNATGTNDNATAPDNTTTATLWTGTSGGINRVYSAGFSVTSGTTYTISAWVKKPSSNAARYAKIDVRSSVEGLIGWPSNGTLDLDTGTISGTGYTVTPYQNGWYRIVSTGTVNSTTTARMFVRITDASGGEPTVTTALLWWGAQAETGSGASSLIPTGASQATRVSEVCYIANTDYGFTTTGGTYFVEWERGEYDNQTVSGGDCFAFSTDYASGRWLAIYTAPGSTTATAGAWSGGINQSSIAVSGRNRAAVSYAGWNATTTGTFSVNGSSPTTSATMALGTTPTYLMIGAASQTAPYNGGGLRDILGNRVRRLKYWPSVLPSATLQSITVNTP
jgi:hypothetical protein